MDSIEIYGKKNNGELSNIMYQTLKYNVKGKLALFNEKKVLTLFVT